MTEPYAGDDLGVMLDRLWALLDNGSRDRHAALHLPTVATVIDGAPSARVMVLRAVERKSRRLTFHSDRRAEKIAGLAADARLTVVGYDAGARLQLRLGGSAVVRSGAAVSARWAAMDGFGRRAYRTVLPPGSPLDSPGTGLPPQFEQSRRDEAPGEAGAENFAVLEVTLDRLEWLLLAHDGHRRAVFKYRSPGWAGQWLVP